MPTLEDLNESSAGKLCFSCESPISEDQQVCDQCNDDGQKIKEDLTEETKETVRRKWWDTQEVLCAAFICMLVIVGVSFYQTKLDGTQDWFEFAKLYSAIAVACFIGVLYARLRKWCWAVVFTLVLSYEVIGYIRYEYALVHGIPLFGFLLLMMAGAPVAFLLCFAESSSTKYAGAGYSGGGSGSYVSSYSSLSCSSYSSCGSSCGGGCGGGGCGGCGG